MRRLEEDDASCDWMSWHAIDANDHQALYPCFATDGKQGGSASPSCSHGQEARQRSMVASPRPSCAAPAPRHVESRRDSSTSSARVAHAGSIQTSRQTQRLRSSTATTSRDGLDDQRKSVLTGWSSESLRSLHLTRLSRHSLRSPSHQTSLLVLHGPTHLPRQPNSLPNIPIHLPSFRYEDSTAAPPVRLSSSTSSASDLNAPPSHARAHMSSQLHRSSNSLSSSSRPASAKPASPSFQPAKERHLDLARPRRSSTRPSQPDAAVASPGSMADEGSPCRSLTRTLCTPPLSSDQGGEAGGCVFVHEVSYILPRPAAGGPASRSSHSRYLS